MKLTSASWAEMQLTAKELPPMRTPKGLATWSPTEWHINEILDSAYLVYPNMCVALTQPGMQGPTRLCSMWAVTASSKTHVLTEPSFNGLICVRVETLPRWGESMSTHNFTSLDSAKAYIRSTLILRGACHPLEQLLHESSGCWFAWDNRSES